MTESQVDLQKAFDLWQKVEEEAKAAVAAAAEKAPNGVSIAGGVDGSVGISIAGEAEAKASAESFLASLDSASSKRQIIMKYSFLGMYHVYIWKPYLDDLYAMSYDEQIAVEQEFREIFGNGGFSALAKYMHILLMTREEFIRTIAGNTGIIINISPIEAAMMRTAAALGRDAVIVSALAWKLNPNVARMPR